MKPDEPVASFNLVSTIMPRGVGSHPRTYQYALVIAFVVALLAAIFGALPIAIMVAVVAIPLVYIVYLYDVNLWEDEPVLVTGLAFGVTFGFSLLFTVLWSMIGGGTSLSGGGGPGVGFDLGRMAVYVLLVPIIGELIRQVGPVILASRPEFDDLMDGLTFGVISGVAFSAAETVVLYWPTLTGGMVDGSPDGWIAVIFLQGFVKPLVIGTATGIACAEFSGLGAGYDGFTMRYVKGLAVAVGANIALYGGIYLFGLINDPNISTVLSVLWGLVLLGILVLRIRTVLHTGLLEAALEASARESGPGPEGEIDFCGQCEMPLLAGAGFCNACGAAVRTQFAKPHGGRAKAAAAAAAAGVGATSSGATSSGAAGAPTAEAETVGDDPSAGGGAATLVAERPTDLQTAYESEEASTGYAAETSTKYESTPTGETAEPQPLDDDGADEPTAELHLGQGAGDPSPEQHAPLDDDREWFDGDADDQNDEEGSR
ncbi:PrsW family glutamic-type intramembrane protease [Microlunatus sp. Y2014]|uniref:PrsW family glutamic-type intramembrane protease n=1 Tax=Microlunatus sp. Y2014 TaxID=3418488 RepID=UPI003DA752F2